jgi:hypothetical protein
MFGNILYPLNTLREIDKDTYESHSSKYMYRETLMELKIPILNCLWNDVLHCSPIDFRLIYKALIRTGHKVGNKEYFKIPIELLKNIKFVKYKFDKEIFDREKKAYIALTTEDIEPLTIGSYRELNELPKKAIEWYKWCADNNKKVHLLFRYIPHIFVKGNIPIKEVDVCDWSN